MTGDEKSEGWAMLDLCQLHWNSCSTDNASPPRFANILLDTCQKYTAKSMHTPLITLANLPKKSYLHQSRRFRRLRSANQSQSHDGIHPIGISSFLPCDWWARWTWVVRLACYRSMGALLERLIIDNGVLAKQTAVSFRLNNLLIDASCKRAGPTQTQVKQQNICQHSP